MIGFGFRFSPNWKYDHYKERLEKITAAVQKERNQRHALNPESHLQIRNPVNSWQSFRGFWYKNMEGRGLNAMLILNNWYSQGMERINQRIIERINKK